MEDVKRQTRRRHSSELKALVLAECVRPGASVARVAMAHGINANVVHKWRRQSGGGSAKPKHREVTAFIPLSLPPAQPAPVADIPELQNGRAGTGNLWTLGVQAIGTNLYSARDTHVLSVSAVSGPELKGWLASYNNLSVPLALWQVEPSLRIYSQTQTTPFGSTHTSRLTPGLRISYRMTQRWTLESDLSVEFSRTRGTSQDESATRVAYSLGYRYDY